MVAYAFPTDPAGISQMWTLPASIDATVVMSSLGLPCFQVTAQSTSGNEHADLSEQENRQFWIGLGNLVAVMNGLFGAACVPQL